MLPASLWHRVFRCLLLLPGSSHPENPLARGRQKTPWCLTATMQPPAGRNLPVKFVDPGFTAAGQHHKNARSYGSGWALLCCGMVSKSLLNLLHSFSAHHPIALVYSDLCPQWAQHPIALVYCDLHSLSPASDQDLINLPVARSPLPSLSALQAQHPIALAHHPISLVYNNLHPQWERSVAFLLRWGGLRSLALTYTHIMQLDTLDSYEDKCHFFSLTYLSLKLRGCVDTSQLFDDLKLGRGKWVLRAGWADGFKALRSLTLKQVDWDYVDFKYLAKITPQLTEFTLYEGWDLDNPSYGPRGGGNNRYSFDLSSARVIRFYFAQSSLTLFLTLSHSLKAFSAVAKRLVLSCKSTVPLYLHHLSLYGQERLVVSSLRLASARVAYLNGPPSDYHSRDDDHYSYWDSPELSPDRRNSPRFSWIAWLAAIAPTVEVLILRHGVPIEKVGAEWSCLRSLGIVVENEERFEMNLEVERRRDDGEKEVTVEEFQERNQRQRILQQQQRQQQPWRQ
ncbi:unnamed protein product [Closterium sp. Naga37s-1]|nr:unnamed protein product [Closterium sp. Naga37s-1]